VADLDGEGREFLAELADRAGCSARAAGSVLSVARTITRVDGLETVKAPAIAEAFTYRATG
jgi:predicted ATPase with chaperone activity